MIKFVDLKTGNVFDGSSPYIFWFDGQQSVGMTYTQPICFISNKRKATIELQSDVFKIIDDVKISTVEDQTIYGFDYKDINDLVWKNTTYIKHGVRYDDYYLYMLYIKAFTEQDGEYVEEFTIDGTTYKIGADFYAENESLYINLSNNGVEIPNSIQKAIYDVNVHEDKRDNIILNRKWKELMSNLWDVVANKGSYLSLVNSLKWFEWGDLLRLCEVWKRKDANKDVYSVRDMQAVLGDKYFETLDGFSKTTYMAICCALQEIVGEQYDKDKNPKLQHISKKWSKEELSLKLSLLGNFYKTYFMPIHLDLIHATIEDVVFTNTFKNLTSSLFERHDFNYQTSDIDCNIKSGDVFRLGEVQVYVNKNTLFGDQYEAQSNYNDFDILGVTFDNKVDATDTNELKTYFAQTYKGIGAVVSFEIDTHLFANDRIKREVLLIKRNGDWKVIKDYKILESSFKFNLLFKSEGDYDIRLQFDTMKGRTFTKRIELSVIDTTHTSLRFFKVQNIRDPRTGGVDMINDYIYSRQPVCGSSNVYSPYIPAKIVNPNTYDCWDYKGVCLNNMLIIRGSKVNEYIDVHYFTFKIQKDESYIVCISKQFGFKPKNIFIKNLDIVRNEYIFAPEYHELVELGSERGDRKEDIKYYTITDEDTLCVVPEIAFGKKIEDAEWEFTNMSTNITLSRSIREPFIAQEEDNPLPPGYYSVKFRYRLGDETNVIEINSAFRKL